MQKIRLGWLPIWLDRGKKSVGWHNNLIWQWFMDSMMPPDELGMPPDVLAVPPERLRMAPDGLPLPSDGSVVPLDEVREPADASQMPPNAFGVRSEAFPGAPDELQMRSDGVRLPPDARRMPVHGFRSVTEGTWPTLNGIRRVILEGALFREESLLHPTRRRPWSGVAKLREHAGCLLPEICRSGWLRIPEPPFASFCRKSLTCSHLSSEVATSELGDMQMGARNTQICVINGSASTRRNNE